MYLFSLYLLVLITERVKVVEVFKESFFIHKENNIMFSMLYNFSVKTGGTICIAHQSAFKNCKNAEDIDRDKLFWIEVEGENVRQLKQNFEMEKEKFLELWNDHLQRKAELNSIKQEKVQV